MTRDDWQSHLARDACKRKANACKLWVIKRNKAVMAEAELPQRRWLLRIAAAILVAVALYVAGLAVVLAAAARGAAALDGDPTGGIGQAVAWGVATATCIAFVAAAVVVWTHPRWSNPLTRFILAAVAATRR